VHGGVARLLDLWGEAKRVEDTMGFPEGVLGGVSRVLSTRWGFLGIPK